MDGSLVFTRLLQCTPPTNTCFLEPTRVPLYFTTGPRSPLNIAFSHEGSGPHLTHAHMLHWAHASPQPKRQLNRFSRFCRTHDRDRQTDQPTGRPPYFVCNNMPHIAYVRSRPTAMRPNNSGHSNLTQGRIADAHGRFSRIRKVVPMCPMYNTCFLPSPQPK